MTALTKKTKPKRRLQERTENTRASLIQAAIALFSELGFDGVTIKDIETKAGVQRGLLVYHFGNKDTLWKAMADTMFVEMAEALQPRLEVMRDINTRDQVALIIRFYVRFVAKKPAVARLMSQEARHRSWRIEYLADRHIRDNSVSLRELVTHALGLTEDDFIHWYYMFVGASSLLFSHAPECQLLFKKDSQQEDIVERHADILVAALLSVKSED